MWEPSCRPTPGTSSRRFGWPAIETRCAILFLLSTARDKFGCGRYGGTSVRRGTGPTLMDKLPGPGVRSLTLGKIPEGGLHIDVLRKTLGAWQTADTMGVFQALSDLWSGWRTECWEDRFEEQAVRCKGALRIPEVDLAAGADSAQAWLRNRAFQSFADGPAGQFTNSRSCWRL